MIMMPVYPGAPYLDSLFGHVQTSETSCNAVNPTLAPNLTQGSDWREELKREIKDGVKVLLQGLKEELLHQVRLLLRPTATDMHPERRYAPPAHCYMQAQRNRWDERGRPICRQCKEPGHMARHCTGYQ